MSLSKIFKRQVIKRDFNRNKRTSCGKQNKSISHKKCPIYW